MKDKGVGWNHAPAELGLKNYLTACTLFAVFGGLPDKSKAQKDENAVGYPGRILTRKQLSESSGMYLIFYNRLTWVPGLSEEIISEKLRIQVLRRVYKMMVISVQGTRLTS